jgi:hypothetical protein
LGIADGAHRSDLLNNWRAYFPGAGSSVAPTQSTRFDE